METSRGDAVGAAWIFRKRVDARRYDNVPLVSPSGALLGLVNEGKASWYVDRGMAARDAEGRIVLNFEPAAVDEVLSATYSAQRKR